jgi:hypothetical protein
MSKERTSSLLPIIKRARKELLPSCLLSNGEGKNLSKEPLSLLPIIKRRRKEPLERTSFPLAYYQASKERTSSLLKTKSPQRKALWANVLRLLR